MQKTQEMRVQSLGQEDPLEEEMATHPSILAWESPQKEEAGGLESVGSQRIEHLWACMEAPEKSLYTIYYYIAVVV